MTAPTARPLARPPAARVALAAAVMLAALSAGFFYAFEASFTLGLAEVDDAAYVATFRAVNATVRNPAFGLVFFGAVPVLAIAAALQRDSRTRRGLVVAALVLHLAVIAITATGNVPLNDQLADPTALTDVTAARAEFEADWNRFNLIRTSVAVGALALLVAANGLPPK